MTLYHIGYVDMGKVLILPVINGVTSGFQSLVKIGQNVTTLFTTTCVF